MNDKSECPAAGMDVIDNCGYFIGTVDRVDADHFVMQKGFFFPESHRIRLNEVASVMGRQVTLRICREQALHLDVAHTTTNSPAAQEIIPRNHRDDAGDANRSAAGNRG